MAVLQNDHFTFINNPSIGTFNISFPQEKKISLINNLVCIRGQLANGGEFSEPLLFKHSEVPVSHLSPESYSIRFSGVLDAISVSWITEFIFSETGDILKWMISLSNHSDKHIYLDRIEVIKPSSENAENLYFLDPSMVKPACFSNGWQSWSYTGAYGKGERMRNSRLGFFQEPLVLNPGTPKYKHPDSFSSDMFTVVGDKATGTGLVLGFLSQREQFGSFSVKMFDNLCINAWANCDHVCIEPGGELHTDWFAIATCDIHDQSTIDTYLEAVKDENEIQEPRQTPSGWCSWYHYYQDISEQIITDNITRLAEIKETLPIDLIQIDDGFQSQVGDWLTFNKKFQNGVSPLAQLIKENGYMAGIWLAPFIVHPKSRLAKEHPDWLLRKKNGKLARAGFGWNSLALALDQTVPEALAYVRQVVRTAVRKWGFTYIKLDFLYAAALACKYRDEKLTRAQVLRMGMQAVRESAGDDVILLGCGAPLGSMLGLVDMMRIGADIGEHWLPRIFNIELPFRQEPGVPSVRNSINNIITRAWSHNKWWVNDPDCLLVRDTSGLTLHEVHTLASVIAMSGGSVVLSEDMQQLSAEHLRIAAAVIPPINQRPKVLDWMSSGIPARMRVDLKGAAGNWHLISYSNWSDQPKTVHIRKEDFDLPLAEYWVGDFWNEKSMCKKRDELLYRGNIQPHATLLLAVRECRADAQYVAGNMHVSQGLEIEKMMEMEGALRITFSGIKWLNGFIELQLERTPVSAILKEKEIRWEKTALGTYRFYFQSIPPGELLIHY